MDANGVDNLLNGLPLPVVIVGPDARVTALNARATKLLGADMLGLLTAQIVKAAGATPVLIDSSEFRLKKAASVGIQNNT